jgi:hypothetical protein
MSLRLLAPVLGTVFAAAPLLASVDGVILNGTTGKPQPDTIVSLAQPGQGGMMVLKSVKTDANGKYVLAQDVQGPQLVQVLYEGVLYNRMVPPGMPTSGINVAVFEATNKAGVAKVSQHYIVLQPGDSELTVSEGILYVGDSKSTYNDPVNGTLKFYVPPGAKPPAMVTVNTSGGMPIQRPATPTKQPNVYKVDYPIRPGETRFDITYSMPAGKPLTFAGKILHTEGDSDLVIPNGVQIKGDDFDLIGQEPKTQANIYKIKKANFQVELDGTGSLTPLAGDAASQDEDNGSPSIQEVKPRIYEKLYWILGMAFAILGLGSVLLYRHGAERA